MSKIKYINLEEVLEDARQVIKFSGVTYKPGNFRATYFNALNSIQKIQYQVSADATAPALNFNVIGSTEQQILSTFGSQDNLEFDLNDCRFSAAEQQIIESKWQEGLDIIKSFDEELYNLVNTIDAQYLFAKTQSHYGGSFWYLIGVIWMSPDVINWTAESYAENILHETIHQCMFLRDMVQTLFSKDILEMANDDALVKSAIRKVKRPYDFAFHAATVSVALVLLYRFLGDEKKATSFYLSSMETLNELEEKKNLLSEQGKLILAGMLNLLCMN